VIVLLAILSFGQSVEKAEHLVPKEIPATAKPELAKNCLQFLGEDKTPVARIWPLESCRGSAEPEQIANGLTLAELEGGQTIGWVEVLKPLKDFRAREIAAGVYCLRLVVQPTSDDHNDTAPGPYFALLVPALDADWKMAHKMETLFKLGTQLLDKHPAVLLFHPSGKAIGNPATAIPKVLTLENGYKAVAWPQKIAIVSQEVFLEMRLVLMGHSPAVKTP